MIQLTSLFHSTSFENHRTEIIDGYRQKSSKMLSFPLNTFHSSEHGKLTMSCHYVLARLADHCSAQGSELAAPSARHFQLISLWSATIPTIECLRFMLQLVGDVQVFRECLSKWLSATQKEVDVVKRHLSFSFWKLWYKLTHPLAMKCIFNDQSQLVRDAPLDFRGGGRGRKFG